MEDHGEGIHFLELFEFKAVAMRFHPLVTGEFQKVQCVAAVSGDSAGISEVLN